MNIQDLYESERKKRRRELIVALASAVLIGILFVVESEITKTGDEVHLSGHLLIFALLTVVILLLILLIFFLVRNIFKLVFERRGKVLGSKLKTRLTLAFVALTLVPTVVLFIASAGVLHTTLESWFTSQVEESLQSSLVVAQAYYQNASDKILNSGTRMAAAISAASLLNPLSRNELGRFLESRIIQEGISSIQIYFKDASAPVLQKDPSLKNVAIPPPVPSFLKIGFQGEKTSKIVSLDGGSDLISAIVPIKDRAGEVEAILVTDYYIQTSLASRLFSISSAFGDYQEAKRRKGPVKTVYMLILLLVALLVIFIGFWFGVTMARDITDPILKLAEGTERIASGDLNVYIEPTADDELGVLVRSFNKMTDDLRENRDELVRVNIDLESRRKYTETILKNVAAGVLSLDAEHGITTANSSAGRLLGITEKDLEGRKISDILPEQSLSAVKELIADLESSGDPIERQVSISFPEKVVSLLCFANGLTDEEGKNIGTVLVFEDMTYLIKAQRMAAWREVARRIAHEIKNPLTPIQLNAQRLRRKYMKVLGNDSEVLEQCTRTIVDQVEVLKNMVNEFSKFARMPSANPVPNELNRILKEVFDLYCNANEKIRLDFEPDPRIPVFDLDKEQMKRAVVNLLDNALAAIDGEGRVAIKTCFNSELSIASIEISDNGRGIAAQDFDRVFEPYFTRKAGGTGLGLTIVSTIVSDHNGFIRVKDNNGKGTKFILELPVRRKQENSNA